MELKGLEHESRRIDYKDAVLDKKLRRLDKEPESSPAPEDPFVKQLLEQAQGLHSLEKAIEYIRTQYADNKTVLQHAESAYKRRIAQLRKDPREV